MSPMPAMTSFEKNLMVVWFVLVFSAVPITTYFGTSSQVGGVWTFCFLGVTAFVLSPQLRYWVHPHLERLHSFLLRSTIVAKIETDIKKWEGVFWPTPIASYFVMVFMGPPMEGFMKIISFVGVFSICALTCTATIAAFRATKEGRPFWSTFGDLEKNNL